ncbi:MAG: DM13 domain-containing protein [Cyanobacteria bacterium P01_D01_bin.128]
MKRMTLNLAAAIALTGFGIGLAPAVTAPVPVRAEAGLKAEIASGGFVTVEQDHPTAGTATIAEKDGQTILEFSGDFTTARGPAVYVVLHKDDSVGVALDEDDYVTIAPLESFDGAQRYIIPESVDVADYSSVVIWCEQFNVTFGFAAL